MAPFAVVVIMQQQPTFDMQIFGFAVLSVITASQNALTRHITKTHLPFVSLNVRELKLMLRRPVKEKWRPPSAGGGNPTLSARSSLNKASYFNRGMRLPNADQFK